MRQVKLSSKFELFSTSQGFFESSKIFFIPSQKLHLLIVVVFFVVYNNVGLRYCRRWISRGAHPSTSTQAGRWTKPLKITDPRLKLCKTNSFFLPWLVITNKRPTWTFRAVLERILETGGIVE